MVNESAPIGSISHLEVAIKTLVLLDPKTRAGALTFGPPESGPMALHALCVSGIVGHTGGTATAVVIHVGIVKCVRLGSVVHPVFPRVGRRRGLLFRLGIK